MSFLSGDPTSERDEPNHSLVTITSVSGADRSGLRRGRVTDPSVQFARLGPHYTFPGIGLIAIPIGFLFNLLVRLVARVAAFDRVLGWLDLSSGAAFTAASRVQFASIASGFLYALMIPYSYVGITMAWRRLRNEPIVEPLMASHTTIRTNDVDLPPA